MPRAQKPKLARGVQGKAPSTSTKPSGTTSTRKPRVMRNRWEQHIYDTYGDDPAFSSLYVSDEELNELYRLLGVPESDFARYRREHDAAYNAEIDNNGGKVPCQGRKPQRDEDPARENIHIVRIPDTSHLVVRFWDGGLEDEGQFCLDIYNMATKEPINSSELGFSIEVAPVAGTLSVMCAGDLDSWEARSGFKPGQILPGEERFSVIEGACLALHRPDFDPFWFKVPVRYCLPDGVRPATPVPLTEVLAVDNSPLVVI
ncbi:hypothetical protein CONPUDRAFT_169576 [Coniophora puteana RWD-64-598 SS2]|uniref:Uncharacterized protein n=1 Tax=Coniophora puteana (strain RWD-64-598) TaxID=741705 RepID=A0A5M3M802_CONPW|nr:uncharacterized protein CONPUDRAFT_169576 [Coniophora puteana RWD-64-598 SS2]EIW75173.1 hypothetical protein CONPUDRAFT_169576 [Coniophora puteana RWD-64-598 SS2]